MCYILPCRNHWISWIFCTIYSLIIMFVVSMVLFLIIISSYSNVKFHVTDASLTQFNLTNNTTLYYNLKVNITVRNHNKHIKVYYRRITAIAWYKDKEFGRVSLTPFDQGGKNTTLLQAVFEGHSAIKLKPKQLGEYKEETSVGIYNDLAVDFDLTVRTRYGSLKTTNDPPIVQCRQFSVPLISNGKSPPPFSVKSCSICTHFRIVMLLIMCQHSQPSSHHQSREANYEIFSHIYI